MALILGKKTFGRLETLQYANNKFKWGNAIIGISCFYGFWAWVLARLTRRNCIYYTIDFYSPEIARNLWDKVFIWAAMQMDKFLINHCDSVWDISTRINKGRLEFGDYINPYLKVVPLSYPPSYFRFHNGDAKKIAFVGIAPYGLELLDNFVWLKGLPITELLYELSHCGIGVSLWKDKGNNYYGDPGKTKLYSACGLPVIMTDNSPYAEIIKETQAGLVVPYEKEAVREAIKEIQGHYAFYKNNVSETWEYINAEIVFRNIRVLGK